MSHVGEIKRTVDGKIVRGVKGMLFQSIAGADSSNSIIVPKYIVNCGYVTS